MTKIPLGFKVPPTYRHVHMLFGDNGFRYVIAVDGSDEMLVGQHGEVDEAQNGCVLDWIAETVAWMREETK